MMDERRAGVRCCAKRKISVPGKHRAIERGEWGTIRHEVENEGRHLILVAWDNGEVAYAFEEELEIPEHSSTQP